MRLLVQKAVYGKDPARGPATPPVAYEYRVEYLHEADSSLYGKDLPDRGKIVLPADERVVAVLP